VATAADCAVAGAAEAGERVAHGGSRAGGGGEAEAWEAAAGRDVAVDPLRKNGDFPLSPLTCGAH
jgi:hypothetical protein